VTALALSKASSVGIKVQPWRIDAHLRLPPWQAINLTVKTQPFIRLVFLFVASQNGAIWLHGACYLIG